LGDVVEFLDSKRKPITESERVSGPYPYYGANGIQDSVADWIFDEELILLAEDGGHFENPDRGVAYKITGRSWVNNHAHVLRPTNKVHIDYLKHVLKNMDLMPYITGSTRLKLNKSSAERIKIPLPPLAEQQRIAAILDKAEEIKRKREQAIAKLDELAQSTFVEMFGDPINNEKSYKCETLANLCHRIQIGPFGTQLHEEDYVENGIPLVNPTHIKNGKINPNNKLTITPDKHSSLSQYHLKEGDLILGRRGEMGRCAVISKEQEGWLCGTGSLFLQIDKKRIHPLYLFSVLSSQSMRKHLESVAQGVTMANLNKDIVGNIKIPLPSIQDQITYARVKDNSKDIIQMMTSSLSTFVSVASSLQHQAFTTGFNA
jgi:type I restriction enzyme S subunit